MEDKHKLNVKSVLNTTIRKSHYNPIKKSVLNVIMKSFLHTLIINVVFQDIKQMKGMSKFIYQNLFSNPYQTKNEVCV